MIDPKLISFEASPFHSHSHIVGYYVVHVPLRSISTTSISRFHAHIAKELDGIVAGAQGIALGQRWRYHAGLNFLANVVAAHIDDCDGSKTTVVVTVIARNR